MAKASALAVRDAAPVKTGPTLLVQIAALVALSLLAAGIGWLSGKQLSFANAAADAAPAHGEASEMHGAAPAHQSTGAQTVVALAELTTNLAAPADVWIRMELAVVLDEPQDPAVTDAISQDLLAYVRTLKLHQIEGASGFAHFRADLEERASIRSGGHVKRVLIKTLLLE